MSSLDSVTPPEGRRKLKATMAQRRELTLPLNPVLLKHMGLITHTTDPTTWSITKGRSLTFPCLLQAAQCIKCSHQNSNALYFENAFNLPAEDATRILTRSLHLKKCNLHRSMFKV